MLGALHKTRNFKYEPALLLAVFLGYAMQDRGKGFGESVSPTNHFGAHHASPTAGLRFILAANVHLTRHVPLRSHLRHNAPGRSTLGSDESAESFKNAFSTGVLRFSTSLKTCLARPGDISDSLTLEHVSPDGANGIASKLARKGLRNSWTSVHRPATFGRKPCVKLRAKGAGACPRAFGQVSRVKVGRSRA